jgi:hypothetical protein
MTENDVPGRREHFIELFLKAIEKCPHAIKGNIGGEKFAREIIEGAKKLHEFIYTTNLD